MASTPKQVNGNGSSNNTSPGKRKKSHGKSSYLSKWLDKTMSHIQDATPSMDTYDFVTPSMNMNWPVGAQFAPGYDPYRNMYGTTEPLSLPTLPSYHNPPMMHYYGQDHRYVQNVNKSIQVQRPRLRRREQKAEEVSYHEQDSQAKISTDNLDYASLPPIITSVGDTNSNSDRHEKDKDDVSNRRFSDPCVRSLPDVAQPANVDSDSDDSNSTDSQMGSKLLICLLDQISSLKRANERLNKDLMDTRGE